MEYGEVHGPYMLPPSSTPSPDLLNIHYSNTYHFIAAETCARVPSATPVVHLVVKNLEGGDGAIFLLI